MFLKVWENFVFSVQKNMKDSKERMCFKENYEIEFSPYQSPFHSHS